MAAVGGRGRRLVRVSEAAGSVWPQAINKDYSYAEIFRLSILRIVFFFKFAFN